jgi:hypothetical protein
MDYFFEIKIKKKLANALCFICLSILYFMRFRTHFNVCKSKMNRVITKKIKKVLIKIRFLGKKRWKFE